MTFKRATAEGVSRILSFRGDGVNDGLRIFLYHSVSSYLPNNYYGINVAETNFARQMNILSRISALSLTSLAEALFRDGPRVAITFDDGYKDNLHTAARILTELNIPFTVFVTTSFVRSGSPEYLTATELRELSSLPRVTIGSHGVTHCRLAECDAATLSRELRESRAILEDIIGRPVTAISYPHGSVSLRVRDAAGNAGYSIGCTSRFGNNNGNQDPLLLSRCEIVAQDTDRVFIEKLNGHWDWKRWR
jgi:peptidoglycan/xylan/chitin deacetylase (PgdA/CDA1 family)